MDFNLFDLQGILINVKLLKNYMSKKNNAWKLDKQISGVIFILLTADPANEYKIIKNKYLVKF